MSFEPIGKIFNKATGAATGAAIGHGYGDENNPKKKVPEGSFTLAFSGASGYVNPPSIENGGSCFNT